VVEEARTLRIRTLVAGTLPGKPPRSFDATHAVGAAVGVPIFQGGALVANYDAAVARAEQAAEQHRPRSSSRCAKWRTRSPHTRSST
jgi:hypothetical protein